MILLQSLQKLDRDLPEILKTSQWISGIKNLFPLLGFVWLAALLAYGYDLTNFSLHIDSELHAARTSSFPLWIQEGRWGTHFLNWLLFPNPILPMMPLLIGIFGYGLGIVLLLRTLTPDIHTAAGYVGGALMVTCPIAYFAFYWQALACALGIGVAAAGAGIWLFSRQSTASYSACILLFTLAIGIYQALAAVIVVMYGIYLGHFTIMQRSDSIKRLSKNAGLFALCLSASLILYAGITAATLWIFNKSFRSAYLGGFIKIDGQGQDIFQRMQDAFSTLSHYYGGSQQFYFQDLFALKLLLSLCILIIINRICRMPSNYRIKIISVVVFAATLLAPLPILMLNPVSLPARTLLVAALVPGAITFLALRLSRSHIAKALVLFLAIYCITQFVFANQRYALSNQLTWQADREFSLQLLQRTQQFSEQISQRPYVYDENLGIYTRRQPLEIIGVREIYPASPLFIQRESIGASFYTWTPNEIRRQIGVFMAMGNFNFWPATRSERQSVIDYALNMPVWPANGAVAHVHGVVIIKLGEYHPRQIETLCAANDNTAGCQKLLSRPHASQLLKP